MKQTNKHAMAYPEYSETPKAVIAAVAYSLALMLNEDNEERAAALLREEWLVLHEAGIVPQKPAIKTERWSD